MLDRLIEQKDAIMLLSHDFPSIPKLGDGEWRLLESLKDVLEPFFDDLQHRRECISSVIPTYRVIFKILKG